MIKRCTGMRRYWNEENIWSTKLVLDPPEMERMKDDELETVEHLHGKSPDQNIDWNEWRDFTWINGYLIKIYESLKKRVGGQENKDNLGRMKQTPLRKLRIDLSNVEMIGSTWREAHRLERINMTISMIKRISTPIEIWEHRLGKVWIQHLNLKQLEYHK